MTWREDLRRVEFLDADGKRRPRIGASFRGVGFYVASSERSGGRRAVVHEFPRRDEPYVEDLGRRARTFRVEGYVVGADYLAQRDQLLAALEADGPGELVHPYHGVLTAACLSVTVRESTAEGGLATFAVEFAETPTQEPMPTEVVDAVARVADAADTAVAEVDAEFSSRFDPVGMAAFALASAEVGIQRAAAGLGAKLAPVVRSTQELAELAGRVALLTAQASSLVRQPAAVVDAFLAVIRGLAETMAAAPRGVVAALLAAYDVDLGPDVAATTGTRERERANQQALAGVLRQVLAIEAARLAPLVPYVSIDEATATRDRIAALIEEQASTAGDYAYPALVSLRAEVMHAVPGGAAFPRIVTVTRNAAIPSLLLAYQLYGGVDLEPDIIARNGIRHPGFVAGDLQVLSDG